MQRGWVQPPHQQPLVPSSIAAGQLAAMHAAREDQTITAGGMDMNVDMPQAALQPPNLLHSLPQSSHMGNKSGGGGRTMAAMRAGADAAAAASKQVSRPMLRAQLQPNQHAARTTEGRRQPAAAGSADGSLQQQARALQAEGNAAGGPEALLALTRPSVPAAVDRSHNSSPADHTGSGHHRAAAASPAASPVWPEDSPELVSDHRAVAAVEGHLAALRGSWHLPASTATSHGHPATHHPRVANASDGGRRKRQRHATPAGELVHVSCTYRCSHMTI